MPQRVADLCRSIQEEFDPKKVQRIDRRVDVLDEERAIKARYDFRLYSPNRDTASQTHGMIEGDDADDVMRGC